MCVVFNTSAKPFIQTWSIVLDEILLMKQLDDNPEGPNLQLGGGHYYKNHWGPLINVCAVGVPDTAMVSMVYCFKISI